MSSLGESLRMLTNILPQIMIMSLVIKLVMNEFMHIVIEPLGVDLSEEKIVGIVKGYNEKYGIPASYEDVILRVSPIGEMFDKWYSKSGEKVAEEVRSILDRLTEKGRLRRVDSGYVG
ncbi:MAG: hypothetical protein QXK24_06505 [Ignisphaera sp.]